MPVPDGLDGLRLDAALSRIFGFSRATAATLVDTGGVTVDGRWLLVRECDDGSQVLTFDSREDLCRHLWEWVDDEPAALHTLRQLGALRFDLDAKDAGGTE